MTSKMEYLDFILEQLDLLDNITYRSMMGEFLLYYHQILIGGIYDDRLLVKIVKENKFMVFTVGNRHVNKLEVPFDEILETIAEHYGFDVVYDFRRNILKNKNYSDTKAQNFKTIKKETILVLQKRSKK